MQEYDFSILFHLSIYVYLGLWATVFFWASTQMHTPWVPNIRYFPSKAVFSFSLAQGVVGLVNPLGPLTAVTSNKHT